MATTLTISEALKNHLARIRNEEDYRSLDAVIRDLLRYPRDGDRRLDGYDQTLTEPVKVSGTTQQLVKGTRDAEGHRDYESVLRDKAGVAPRDTGEEPIEVKPLN